jgi:hypothetical protein
LRVRGAPGDVASGGQTASRASSRSPGGQPNEGAAIAFPGSSKLLLELQVDTGLLASLLDDRLTLLMRRIDRGLEYDLQLLAVLGPDTVGPALPTGLVQDLVRLVDTELPLRVLRNKELCPPRLGARLAAALCYGP